MADSVTVTTTRSWGQRLKSALAGLILGPVLIIGSLWGLSYNESHSADVIASVAEGRKVVIESPSILISPEHEGKFIHMIGTLSGDILLDDTFQVSVTGVVLSRNVLMYQWKESSSSTSHENMGGSETTTTTYSYKKEWSEKQINSSDFHEQVGHMNPSSWKYVSEQKQAPRVSYGSYVLGSSLVSLLPVDTPLSLQGKNLVLGTGESLVGQEIYVGKNPASPEVGDMRISFAYIPDGTTVSALAEKRGDTIVPPGNPKLRYASRVVIGTVTAEAMFESILTENSWMTWLFRAAGLLVLFIGWNMFFAIIPMLGKFIPLLGTIIGFGTGLIAFILTLILGGGMIIIAWFAVRPVYSLIGLTLIALISYSAWKFFKKDETTLTPPTL